MECAYFFFLRKSVLAFGEQLLNRNLAHEETLNI